MKLSETHFRYAAFFAVLTLSATIGFGQTAPQVIVKAEAEKKSFVEGSDLSFRCSITNNSEQRPIAFITCPPAYDVTLSDSQGRSVPLSESYQRKLKTGGYVCESTTTIEVEPGQTWGPEVWPTPDRGMFDLKPGTYTGRLIWHFTVREEPLGGNAIGQMTVPSNSFVITVVPRP